MEPSVRLRAEAESRRGRERARARLPAPCPPQLSRAAPDLKRIHALAEQLSTSKSLAKIKKRDFLMRYIELYMVRCLQVKQLCHRRHACPQLIGRMRTSMSFAEASSVWIRQVSVSPKWYG